MKSIYELSEEQWMKSPSNNWLRMHGFAMHKHNGRRKRLTKKEWQCRYEMPFK